MAAPLLIEVHQRPSRYERRVASLIGGATRMNAARLVKLRRAYRTMVREILSELPKQFQLSQTTIVNVLQQIAASLDRWAVELDVTIRTGMMAQDLLAQEMIGAYGTMVAAQAAGLGVGVIPFVGVDTQLVGLAFDHSADLIGGLTNDMRRRINVLLRSEILAPGAAGGMHRAAADINAILGENRWLARGEAIYRTEVLRVQSMATQAGIIQANRMVPTKKAWQWSKISRLEHSRINGQVREATERFRVPLRRGGVTMMMFPRDPRAPAGATINCGCWHFPVPAESFGTATIQRSDELVPGMGLVAAQPFVDGLPRAVVEATMQEIIALSRAA